MAKQIDENIYSRSFVEAVDATKFARVRLVTQRSQLGKSENRVEERLGRIACGGCYEFFPSFISFNVYIGINSEENSASEKMWFTVSFSSNV